MRGKTKIGTSALMLSVILSSIFMALTFAPASANPTATLELPTMVNPLLDVGDTFTIDVLVRDVTKLWSYQFAMAYDTSVLTCIDYATVRANPVAMINMLPSGIDDSAGIMWMGATRKVGDTVGVTTEPGLPMLIALVTFRIDARGESPLVMYDIALTNVYGASIDTVGIDGYFNDKLQGYIMAPEVIDTSKTIGSHVDVYISVREVVKLWGLQFKLFFDPAILEPSDYEGLTPFTVTEPGLNEMGPNYFRIAWHSYFGDPDGLTTTDPYPAIRLGFTVKNIGVTLLDLEETVMADADGNKLIHGVEDGSFANTYSIAISLDTGFLETHNYVLSQDTDGLITLTGQIKNSDVGITKGRVRFTVFDAAGSVAAEMVSEAQTILVGGNYRCAVDLPATSLIIPGVYDVVFRAEYLDAYGDWVAGMKGSPSANRATMVKTMTVEA